MKRTLLGALSAVAILFSAPTAIAGVIGPFSAIAEGTMSIEGNEITIDTDVIFQDPDLGLLTFFAELTIEGKDNPFGLSGIFMMGALDGNLFGEVNGSLFINEDFGFASTAGKFNITGGSGIFEGITGTGVFTAITNLETGATLVQIVGVLVPAPGAFAALAMAGLMTGRRRRRAALLR